jgi:hypothetical protein
VCNYTSNKYNLTRHLSKQKSCGSGVREIIEVQTEKVICEYCNNSFSEEKTLNIHLKKGRCSGLDNTLIAVENRQLKKENEKLKEEKNKLMSNDAELSTTVNNITNTVNNTINNINNTVNNTVNNININNTINVYILNYKDTKEIKDSLYRKAIDAEVHKIIPTLIKFTHFNKDIPENHNIYISNKSKYNNELYVFKNNEWQVMNKKTEINNIIHDKENCMDDWVKINKEIYPDAEEKYNTYLERRKEKEVKEDEYEEVEFLLYNSRNMAREHYKKLCKTAQSKSITD